MSNTAPRSIHVAWWLSLIQMILVRYVRVEEQWVETVRRAAERGPVCFVMRNRSVIDFLCLRGLLKRYDLPPLRFVSGVSGITYLPVLSKIASLFKKRSPGLLALQMTAALKEGGSAAVFLRRPAVRGVLGSRSVSEDGLLAAATAQTAFSQSIQALPTVFLWGESAMKRMPGTMDFLFGSNEYPRLLRSIRLLLKRRSVHRILAAEPIDIANLKQERSLDVWALAAAVRSGVLRRIEIIRRAKLGALTKPSARVAADTLKSPRLRRSLLETARREGIPDAEIEPRARAVIRKLAADFKPGVLSLFATVVGAVWKRLYTGIDIREEDVERIRNAVAQGACLLLPSHKSHSDYLLMSHLFREHNLMMPHIAAGQNLSFWPLGFLFRSSGAFFIRRRFLHDRFYTAVVNTYVRRLIFEGYTVEVFIEGGRSRTGKLLRPKTGMLDMALQAAALSPKVPLSVLPVCIGYEHVIEEGAYVAESRGIPKKPESVAELLKTTSVLFHRYGRVYVRVAEPFSVDKVLDAHGLARNDLRDDAVRRSVAHALGMRTLSAINRMTVAGASAIFALVLLSQRKLPIPHGGLKTECLSWIRFLNAAGVTLSDTVVWWHSGEAGDRMMDRSIRAFVRSGRMSRVPGKGEARYTLKEGKREALDYYKNTILHFFVPASLTAAICLAAEEAITEEALRKKLSLGLTLYSHEFMLEDFELSQAGKSGAPLPLGRILIPLVETEVLAVSDGRVQVKSRVGAARLRDVMRSCHEAYLEALLEARRSQTGSVADTDCTESILEQPEASERTPESRSKLLRQSVQHTLKELRLAGPGRVDNAFAQGELGAELTELLSSLLEIKAAP